MLLNDWLVVYEISNVTVNDISTFPHIRHKLYTFSNKFNMLKVKMYTHNSVSYITVLCLKTL